MIQVIKIGGNVVDNPELLAQFVKDFAALKGPKILVHGGGVMASQLLKSMGIAPKMVEGRRITDAETLRVVTMVYAGWCGKHISALLQAEGCNAMSLSGCDGNVIRATQRQPKAVAADNAPVRQRLAELGLPQDEINYGYVGDLSSESVNAPLLLRLIESGLTPVLNAINHDGTGHLLNTNADTIASSVAVALAQLAPTRLIYCFEKPGVLMDKDDDSSVIPHITPAEYAQLKAEGIIADGMIPKLDNSFKAIACGVEAVSIKHANAINSDVETTLTAE